MDKLAVVLISLTGPVLAIGWLLFGLGLALIVSALILTPIAWLAWQDDKKVDQRDKDVPVFLRGLGSVMGAVGTTVAEGLSRLNRRSLGAMETHVRKLYVRLSNDLPSDITWARLAGALVFGLGWQVVLVGSVCLTGLHLAINGSLYLARVRKNL